MNVHSGGELHVDGAFTNSASGGLLVGGDTARFQGGLVNEGFVAIYGSGGTLFGDITNVALAQIVVAAPTTFGGSLLNAGELQIQAGQAAVFLGDVRGPSSFTGTGTKVYEGGFPPGASPGLVFDEGNALFGTAALIEMEIAGHTQGVEYDHYRVGGRLELGGTLRVKLLEGFSPIVGDAFDLFDATTLRGLFASFDFD